MAIPYQIAKLESANIFAMAIWGRTAKFNSCQYFWLYGILIRAEFATCDTADRSSSLVKLSMVAPITDLCYYAVWMLN